MRWKSKQDISPCWGIFFFLQKLTRIIPISSNHKLEMSQDCKTYCFCSTFCIFKHFCLKETSLLYRLEKVGNQCFLKSSYLNVMHSRYVYWHFYYSYSIDIFKKDTITYIYPHCYFIYALYFKSLIWNVNVIIRTMSLANFVISWKTCLQVSNYTTHP